MSFALAIHAASWAVAGDGYAAVPPLDWTAPALTLGDDDVAWLDWGRQELALTPAGAARLRATPHRQHPFALALDGRTVYEGMFLEPISAMAIAFPVAYEVEHHGVTELWLRPRHTLRASYASIPAEARAAIEVGALRDHFAAAGKLVGAARGASSLPLDVPPASADYREALGAVAAYRRGDIGFAELRATLLGRALPPHPLGCAYLLVSPPPPPPGVAFDPGIMPADFRGTWGEVAMTHLLGGLDRAEYDLLHRAAHPACPR